MKPINTPQWIWDRFVADQESVFDKVRYFKAINWEDYIINGFSPPEPYVHVPHLTDIKMSASVVVLDQYMPDTVHYFKDDFKNYNMADVRAVEKFYI